jgi:hypothetical protein
MDPIEIAKLIRTRSHPKDDVVVAIKHNANLLDALYRLSFTADACSAGEIDNLVNELKSHNDEVMVLLGRIVEIKKHGYSNSIFQGTQPKSK